MDAQTLIVAATFIGTLIVVSLIAYLVLADQEVEDKPGSTFREPNPRALEKKVARLAQWLRATTGASPLDPTQSPRREIGPRETRLMKAVLFVVGGVVVLGMAAALLWIADSLEPVLQPISRLIFRVMTYEQGPAALAVIVLIAGLPFSKRFRQPRRFRVGLIVMALALATLWPLQGLVVVVTRGWPFWEWKAAVHVAALLLSCVTFFGGFESIRRSMNTPEDDSWEFMR